MRTFYSWLVVSLAAVSVGLVAGTGCPCLDELVEKGCLEDENNNGICDCLEGGTTPCEDLDDDNDGVNNCDDLCPGTPTTHEDLDDDGCSCSQLDDDDDGFDNCDDCCPDTPPDTSVDDDGCPAGDYESGEAIYTSDCTGCHDSSAPELDCKNARVCDLDAKLRDPAVSHGGGKFGLTDQEIADLTEYFCD